MLTLVNHLSPGVVQLPVECDLLEMKMLISEDLCSLADQQSLSISLRETSKDTPPPVLQVTPVSSVDESSKLSPDESS